MVEIHMPQMKLNELEQKFLNDMTTLIAEGHEEIPPVRLVPLIGLATFAWACLSGGGEDLEAIGDHLKLTLENPPAAFGVEDEIPAATEH